MREFPVAVVVVASIVTAAALWIGSRLWGSWRRRREAQRSGLSQRWRDSHREWK